MELTKKEEIELAAQLRKPFGEVGVEVADVMNETNVAMINNTIEALNFVDDDKILELGHGNGHHILRLLQEAENLNYQGLDISTLMKSEAEKYCTANNILNQTSFKLYDGKKVPFEENTFNKIFTINTLYFWEEPKYLLRELHRVLHPGGFCCITFITENAMEGIGFTNYGFEKYTKKKFIELVNETGFKILSLDMESERISGKLGDLENREYIIGKLSK